MTPVSTKIFLLFAIQKETIIMKGNNQQRRRGDDYMKPDKCPQIGSPEYMRIRGDDSFTYLDGILMQCNCIYVTPYKSRLPPAEKAA
ncbi:MAG: hypothetical protein V1802_02480 [Candidatus Aenigmatarchaeota archaeon]